MDVEPENTIEILTPVETRRNDPSLHLFGEETAQGQETNESVGMRGEN